MPGKKKTEALLTPNQAADAANVSRTSLSNWLKKEKDLAGAVTRKDGRVFFPPAAMKTLEQVKARRYKAVNPALRKAWAARRKGGAATKVAPTPRSAPAAMGMSGGRAAKELGIAKPRLYEILKRAGIQKPAARNAFTPDILDQVRAAMGKATPAGTAKTARRRVATSRRRAKLPATPPGAASDISTTVATMLEKALGSARDEARVLARRALEEARAALDRGLKALG